MDKTRREGKFTRLAFTGPKGGTGKTTLAVLITEYLIYKNKRVNLRDLDPTQALSTWISNCSEEGKKVNSLLPADYQISDAPGIKGGELTGDDYLMVPFVAHYIDLQVLINWYNSLTIEQQKKVYFVPNRYQRTKEQKEALKEFKCLQEKTGRDVNILSPLPNRPALFAPLLNGTKINFFETKGGKVYLDYFADLFKQLRASEFKSTSIPNYA